MNNQTKNSEITIIGLSIAIIIGGGMAIYMIAAVFPLPGIKYIFVAPFVSTIFYVVQHKLKGKYILPKIGTVFGLVMSVINMYMGLAILITTFLAYISSFYLKSESKRIFWSSAFFSGYTGLIAILVSKYLIGGVFLEIPNSMIALNSILGLIFGILGNNLAKTVVNRVNKDSGY